MVKPIYEANKGTAVADVIAGLIFSLAINQNREQFLVADANERRTEAERKLAEADRKIDDLTGALRSLAEGNLGDMSWQANYETIKQVARNAISKEAERG